MHFACFLHARITTWTCGVAYIYTWIYAWCTSTTHVLLKYNTSVAKIQYAGSKNTSYTHVRSRRTTCESSTCDIELLIVMKPFTTFLLSLDRSPYWFTDTNLVDSHTVVPEQSFNWSCPDLGTSRDDLIFCTVWNHVFKNLNSIHYMKLKLITWTLHCWPHVSEGGCDGAVSSSSSRVRWLWWWRRAMILLVSTLNCSMAAACLSYCMSNNDENRFL